MFYKFESYENIKYKHFSLIVRSVINLKSIYKNLQYKTIYI